MPDRDTIAILAGELGAATEPLSGAFQSPGNFSAFMHGLGWEFDDIPPALTGMAAPLSTIASIVNGEGGAESDVPALLAAVAGLIGAINGIPGQPDASFPAALDVAAFKNDFPGQIVDFLVAEYLLNIRGNWGYLLKLIGVIRVDLTPAGGQRPEYFRRSIAWNDLVNFFGDPSAGGWYETPTGGGNRTSSTTRWSATCATCSAHGDSRITRPSSTRRCRRS